MPLRSFSICRSISIGLPHLTCNNIVFTSTTSFNHILYMKDIALSTTLVTAIVRHDIKTD